MRKEKTEAPTAGEVSLEIDAVNEAVIVAAAAVSPEIRRSLVQRITADSFLEPRHSSAWSAYQELERRHFDFDLATLPTLVPGVDVAYLAQLLELRSEPPANLEHHVQTLCWDRARVTAWSGPISGLIDAVRDPRADRERVKALARQVQQTFDGFGDRRHLLDPQRLVRDQMEEIRQRRNGVAIHPYGVKALDELVDGDKLPLLIPGTAPGQVTLVTGLTGSGKSSLTAHFVVGQARRKRRVLVGAWEVNGGLTLELAATLALGWSRTAVTVGNLTDEHLVVLERTMRGISRWVRFIANPFNRREAKGKASNERNLDLIHGYIADTGCDVFIADLWERCLVDDDPASEKNALYRQQAMAEETKCHVVVVQQQNVKQLKAREDKRPALEIVKGNGAYVEIADTVLGTHRPAMFKAVPDNTIEIIVLKQRRGRSNFIVECDWVADTGQMSNGREVAYDAGPSGGEMESFIEEKGSQAKFRKNGRGR